MDEQTLLFSLQQVLEEQYGQTAAHFQSLNTRSLEDERVVYTMYRVERAQEPSWVLCAAHEELIHSHTFRWEWSGTVPTWLEARAQVLLALYQQGYPAPSVILAKSGEPVVQAGAWSVFITTWVSGQNSQFQPEPLAQAGALLARLHLLPLETMPLQSARWNTTYSIPHALHALEAVRACLPVSARAFSTECALVLREVLQKVPTLPHTLLHGDCWMQNAVMTADAGMIFIDWECAGRGVALLDLGDFLFRSQCRMDGAPPDALLLSPVESAAAGYASCRMPDNDERDLLMLAMRFSIVWRAAWMLARTQVDGWTARREQGLTRVQSSYALVEPTTRLAHSAFQRVSQRM